MKNSSAITENSAWWQPCNKLQCVVYSMPNSTLLLTSLSRLFLSSCFPGLCSCNLLPWWGCISRGFLSTWSCFADSSNRAAPGMDGTPAMRSCSVFHFSSVLMARLHTLHLSLNITIYLQAIWHIPLKHSSSCRNTTFSFQTSVGLKSGTNSILNYWKSGSDLKKGIG